MDRAMFVDRHHGLGYYVLSGWLYETGRGYKNVEREATEAEQDMFSLIDRLTYTPTHSFARLLERWVEAGWDEQALKDLLTDWVENDYWDPVLFQDPALLPEVEFSVARHLGLLIETIRNPLLPLR